MHSAVRVLVGVSLVASLLTGCLSPAGPFSATGECDAVSLVHGGVEFLDTQTVAAGGVAPRPGDDPDPRLTAWVLIATGVAKRTGQEGSFDGRVHRDWLQDELPGMMQEGTGVDSTANNLSLARAALQAWGRMAQGVPLQDPEHPGVESLADAWQARYDEASGVYAQRFNEHLFAGFAARVFEDNRTRLDAMGRALDGTTPGDDGALYERDAWYAGYARALLGPEPVNVSLAARLDAIMSERQQADGGLKGFADAAGPDASTTAAALLGWQASGRSLQDEEVEKAVAYLCGLMDVDGAVVFSADREFLRVKTTAEVVIALSLYLEPIPWPQPPPGS